MKNIKKIKIDSYRGIKNLEFDNLSLVNIITGDNNCGKTSLLEVLNSFAQPDDILMWNSLIRKESTLSYRSGLTYFEGIYDLFDINSSDKKISYVLETEDRDSSIEVKANETVEQISEFQYSRLAGYMIQEEDAEALQQTTREVKKLQFQVFFNGENIVDSSIYEGQRQVYGRERYIKRNPELTRNIVYISPFRHATGTVFLSEVLDNPELYEEMLSILKEYDENIISINYDNDGNSSAGIYKILAKSQKKALPLNVYGDGMKKAILLMSAVIKAQNGILLLDEFETAIHTSAMKKTFKWILETCKKLNVQVFMTTHSKEAIDKVLKCSPDLEDDIAVYTMYKDDESITVRRLAAVKAIEVQDEMGLELR